MDHRNRQPLDNRSANLRSATRVQQRHNIPKGCHNTSGYIGVTKHGDKWRSQITIDGVRQHIGYYDTPLEAARARDAHVRRHLNGFGVLNFE